MNDFDIAKARILSFGDKKIEPTKSNDQRIADLEAAVGDIAKLILVHHEAMTILEERINELNAHAEDM